MAKIAKQRWKVPAQILVMAAELQRISTSGVRPSQGTVSCKIWEQFYAKNWEGAQVEAAGLRGEEQFYAKFGNSFMQTDDGGAQAP